MLIQILGGLLLFALGICLLIALLAWWTIVNNLECDDYDDSAAFWFF